MADENASTESTSGSGGEYAPSPRQGVAEQVEIFERTGGAEANTLRGVPIVVVTTRGARTGKIRKVPVMRVEEGGVYAVVASMGGAPKNPVWYYNLVADPDVMLQDGADVWPAKAREVSGEEKQAWWQRAIAVWPDYAEYQKKTDREIPVFVIERTQG